MDICHLKNAELEAKHQKYKGRVVLRGDIVKDDSGSYAVFTEQGSSASQMTAAKIMDIISRLPGCAGEAADAVSACTPLKMEDPPKLLKIPKSECPDIWIRLPRHKWPKSWSSLEDPVVPLERNLWSSFGRTVTGKAIWENPIEVRLGEGFQLGMLIRTPWKRIILICVCGWHKLAGKKLNINPMWKVLNKEVDLVEPTSFPNHVYLGCTQRQNKQGYCGQLQNHVWIQNFRRSNWKITMIGKYSYFFMVLWHGRSCKEMCRKIFVSWRTKRLSNCTKYQLHALMTTTSKKKKWNLLENCHKCALKLV